MNIAEKTVPENIAVVNLAPKDIIRFWKKVKKSESGCWLWTATKQSDGYGSFWLSPTMVSAHRVSWMIHNGMPPHGIFVLHNCPGGDNPACVNPNHLFLGTQTDNMQDMLKKNRGNKASGDANGARRHPEKLKRGDNHPARLHPENMSRGDSHYLRIHPEMILRGEDQGRAILSEEKVIRIRLRFAAGNITKASLARENNVSESLIRSIVQRKLWTHI